MRILKRERWLFAALMLGTSIAAHSDNTSASVSNTESNSPDKMMLAFADIPHTCRFEEVSTPLSLIDIVERALCNSPKTRQAWINVKMQAAQVGISKAAYFPTLSATLDATKINSSTVVNDVPGLNSQLKTSTHDSSLSLSWTLFDFGLRRANLDNAHQLLIAANASQDATLQATFAAAAQAYYDVLSAQSALDASMDAEESAKESWMAADAKHKAGVGTLADKLQAQTAYAQATLGRVKANGELKNARGTLALTMGLDANTDFTLRVDEAALPDTTFVQSVDALINDAKLHHPSLLAAQAQLQAARANVKAARAAGLPSISLVGGVGRNNPSSGFPALSSNSTSKSIGVQVKIPLFEGFGRSHQIEVAKVQVESKAIDLADTEMQVSLDVWKSYQALAMETEDLKATDDLLESATQSFDVARGRYKAGVGNMLDLLNAQSALASARQQRIQALSNWRTARLKLAASLGKLGFWAIQ